MVVVVKLSDEVLERWRLIDTLADALRQARLERAWNEDDHPRDDSGRFGSGGGGSSADNESAKGKVGAFLKENLSGVVGKIATKLKDNQKELLAGAVTFALYHVAGADFPADVEHAIRNEVVNLASTAQITVALARDYMQRVVSALVKERKKAADPVLKALLDLQAILAKEELFKAAEWNEEDHPRDDRGRFGSGGGGSSSSAQPTPGGEPVSKNNAWFKPSQNAAENSRRIEHTLQREAGISRGYRFATGELVKEYKTHYPERGDDAKVTGLKAKIGESFFKEGQRFIQQGKTSEGNKAIAKSAELGYQPQGGGGTTQQGQRPEQQPQITQPKPEIPKPEVSEPEALLPVVHSGTSLVFQETIALALARVPANVQSKIAKAGIVVKTGKLVSSLKPELKDMKPRGWPKGMTWDNAEGLYSPSTREIVTTEFKMTNFGGIPNKMISVEEGRLQGVFLHETGHGFDAALGRASSSPAFSQAYREDTARIAGPRTRDMLSYYLQDPPAGPEEAFAELFAANTSARSHGASSHDIRRHFPQTSKLVKQAIDSGEWAA